MVQVPARTIVTVVPETVQAVGVSLLKVTVSPEVADALTPNGGSPYTLFPSALNVIVWLALATVKERVTSAAAFQSASPPWLARMGQVPGATIVTVVPETVQTPGVSLLKETVRPDDEVALMPKGGSP